MVTRKNLSFKGWSEGYGEIELSGPNSKCSITFMEGANNIEKLDYPIECKIFKNSKNVKIACTSDKKMCKTEKEIIDFTKGL